MFNLLLVLLFLFLQPAQADMHIGHCTFYGSKPSSGTLYMGMTIYHQGDLKNTQVKGGVQIWEGSGPVWVIYNSSKALNSVEFRINGNLQTCSKNMR